MLNKIIKSIIVLTVLTVPLFYLPFTQSQFQFNKEMLFLGLTLVASLLFLGRAIRNKKLELIRTPLDIPIILVVVVYGLAMVISSNWQDSLINIHGAGLPSFVTILSLAIFYFVSVNVFAPDQAALADESAKRRPFRWVQTLLITFLVSSVFVQLVAYLSWFKVLVLPGQTATFNLLGTYSRLAVFVALTIPLALYFVMVKLSQRRGVEYAAVAIAGLYLLFSLLTLNTINYNLGWWVAIVGAFVFLVLFTAYYNQLPARLNLTWVPACVLAICLISIVLRPTSLIATFAPENLRPNVPSEAFLNNSSARQLAITSSISDPVTFIVGKGPGNFGQVFSQNRSTGFNDSVVWRVRFSEASNFFYEAIATIGWLGLVSFLVLILFFIGTVGFLLYRMHPVYLKRHNPGSESAAATADDQGYYTFSIITMMSVFIALAVSLWFNLPSMAVILLLGLVLSVVGILSILHAPKEFTRMEFNFKDSARDALSSSFGLVFVFVLLLFLGVHLARVYSGENIFFQARQLLGQNLDLDKLNQARAKLDQAIAFNPARPEYYLANAQASLFQVQLMVRDQGIKNVDQKQLQQLLATAINQSNIAVDLNPKLVSTWENRGLIFETVSNFTDQARVHAILSFEQASKLEPTNPVLYFKLGDNQRLLWATNEARAKAAKTELTPEQIEANLKLYDDALANLKKAVELKPDYISPRLALARIYEGQNNIPGAIAELRALMQFNPQEAEAYYELARLLYNGAVKENFSNSESANEIVAYLNAALQLSPQYSNALYTRSLVFKELKRYDLAMVDMEQVATLNPDNPEVTKKVAELKQLAGKTGPEVQPVVAGEQVEAGDKPATETASLPE